MSIYVKELTAQIKSLLQWLFALLAIALASALLYRYLFQDNHDISTYLELIPATFHSVIGLSPDAVYFTASGYWSVLAVFGTYLLAFQAAFVGTRIIGRERDEQAQEFLYSLPISRNLIMLLKLLAGLTICLLINIVFYWGLRTFFAEPAAFAYFGAYSRANFCVQLVFFSLGAFLTLFCNQYFAARIMGLLTLVAIMIDRILGLLENAGGLWLLSPFQYFPALSYLDGSGLALSRIVLCLAIALLCLALILLIHDRRDLRLD